jgi:hypothetical protein
MMGQFMVALGHTDLRLALGMAVGSAAFEAFGEARRQGHDRDDVTSILGLREDEAGINVRLGDSR